MISPPQNVPSITVLAPEKFSKIVLKISQGWDIELVCAQKIIIKLCVQVLIIMRSSENITQEYDGNQLLLSET